MQEDPSVPDPQVVAVVDAVLATARELLGCELVAFNRVEPDVVLTARTRGSLPGLSPGAASTRTDTPCHLLLSGAPAWTTHAPTDPVYGTAAAVHELGLQTYVGVPVRDADGRPVATLCGFDRGGVPVTHHAVEVLAGLASVLTPYACQLRQLDVALVRGDGRWVVQGYDGEDAGTALAAVADEPPGVPPVQARAWWRSNVRALEVALDSRVVVEQALGILSERHGVTPRRSWDLLRDQGSGDAAKAAALLVREASASLQSAATR